MIRKITYNIRFPFGGIFKSDPKYLILRNIYYEIHKSSVVTDDDSIYYFISGENFAKYPGIIVSRDFVEKTNFKKNETLEISFFLMGNVEIYQSFITEYFNNREYIERVYFQKRIIDNTIIDEKETYSGLVEIQVPINSIEDSIESLVYYNNVYQTNFTIPTMKLNEVKTIADYSDYPFNHIHFHIRGEVGLMEVKDYSKVLLSIGIGKTSIIGGGRGKCV